MVANVGSPKEKLCYMREHPVHSLIHSLSGRKRRVRKNSKKWTIRRKPGRRKLGILRDYMQSIRREIYRMVDRVYGRRWELYSK
jgi:hypothetical protein